MDMKQARGRIATARTALQKADSITELCKDQERYSPVLTQLEMIQREVHQQVGRLDLLISIIESVQDATEEE